MSSIERFPWTRSLRQEAFARLDVDQKVVQNTVDYLSFSMVERMSS